MVTAIEMQIKGQRLIDLETHLIECITAMKAKEYKLSNNTLAIHTGVDRAFKIVLDYIREGREDGLRSYKK